MIRGVDGAFDKALEGDRRNMKEAKPDIKIFFNTTINIHNYEQLTGVARLAKANGVDGMTLEMTNNFDKYSPNDGLMLTEDKNAPSSRTDQGICSISSRSCCPTLKATSTSSRIT